MTGRFTRLLRENWPVVLTLVVGAGIVAAVGFAAHSTTGAMWAGGVVGVLVGVVIGWQNQRRESRSGRER